MWAGTPEKPTAAIERPPLKSNLYNKGTAPFVARMPRQFTASSDFELIQKINSEYSNAWEAHRKSTERMFQAWKMYFGADGEQWDEDARKYKEERDQRIAQYNIIKQKVRTLTGMLIADEYDFKYNPVNGERNSGVEALENAYYCDKEVCDFESAYNKVIEDGVVHKGILEIGVTTDHDYRGNICFKRAIPGRWVVDPYWKTDDDCDCLKAWKHGNMTIQQLMRVFKNLPSSERFDAELQRIEKSGMDWTSPEINEYNYAYPLFRNAFHVVEYHWVEKIKKKRIVAKNLLGDWISFPTTNDNALLEKFALENGVVDWKEGNAFIAPYDDKIHYSAIICPELWPNKLLERGKPEIQVKGLPIIQFSLQRDIAGRDSGVVMDLVDVQRDLNYSQSKIQEILANALGGGTVYNKDALPDESDQEDFEKHHNDPTRAWGINGNPSNFSQHLSDHQINQELIRKTGEAFDYADRISPVSAAMQSETQGSSEPASLFAMKLKVNKIGTLLIDKRVKRLRQRMAEAYFYQAQITYSGAERKFSSKDGKRDAVLNEDLGCGYKKNDVTQLPRIKVTISESENNLTKQMRDRTDIAAILQSTPPEYREVIAIQINELIKTTSIQQDKKGELQEALLLERLKARLATIAEIKNNDAVGAQAELTKAQSLAGLSQLEQQLMIQGQSAQQQQTPEMITRSNQQITVPQTHNQGQQEQLNISEPTYME